MGDTHGQLIIFNQSTIGASMRILLKERKRPKLIGLRRGGCLLHTFGRHEGVPYNVIILRHICGFLVYIDDSI